MQYLANKFSESTSTAKAASAAPKLGPLSRSGRLQMAEAGRSNPNGSGGGGVAIQTETYLKLLKEGTPAKKKSSNAPRIANRGPNVMGRKIAEPGEADIAMPMTLSSLGKTWSTAMSGETPTTAEEVPQIKSTQDDISSEKVLKDHDRSEPAYWSDTESMDLQCASAHRLGRRPKIATAMIRSYVMQDLSYALDQAVGMMIRRLQRYMDHHRAFASKPCQEVGAQTPGRRFVIGLKEVSRRTKQSRVACLIVAPDIEEDANSGGLDDRMRELLATAYENGTPVIFALTRARLGKALGKSLHISVLGVVDATGARDLLQESLHLADKCRKAWLARLGK
jgi:ribosomal protein L7Ae-like RNA K-turn-binding protein